MSIYNYWIQFVCANWAYMFLSIHIKSNYQYMYFHKHAHENVQGTMHHHNELQIYPEWQNI